MGSCEGGFLMCDEESEGKRMEEPLRRYERMLRRAERLAGMGSWHWEVDHTGAV